jgi:hypothetical protein
MRLLKALVFPCPLHFTCSSFFTCWLDQLDYGFMCGYAQGVAGKGELFEGNDDPGGTYRIPASIKNSLPKSVENLISRDSISSSAELISVLLPAPCGVNFGLRDNRDRKVNTNLDPKKIIVFLSPFGQPFHAYFFDFSFNSYLTFKIGASSYYNGRQVLPYFPHYYLH